MTLNSDVFPELNHELIKPLQNFSDGKLWNFWLKYPEQKRYLIMIFFRYAFFPLDIASNEHKIELSSRYLESLWTFIFHRFFDYQSEINPLISEIVKELTQQFLFAEKFIINSTFDNQDYSNLRYFPLKYYLTENLDRLSNLERIILVVKDKFVWEDEKILQYLKQKKQTITLTEINAYYTQAHSRLLNYLPLDIISIYLSNNPS